MICPFCGELMTMMVLEYNSKDGEPEFVRFDCSNCFNSIDISYYFAAEPRKYKPRRKRR